MKLTFKSLWETITNYIFIGIYGVVIICLAVPLGVINYLLKKGKI